MCQILDLLNISHDIANTIIRLWTFTGGVGRILRRVCEGPMSESILSNEILYVRNAVESCSTTDEMRIMTIISTCGKKNTSQFLNQEQLLLNAMKRKGGMIVVCVNLYLNMNRELQRHGTL